MSKRTHSFRSNSELEQVGGPNVQKPKKANTNYEHPDYAVFSVLLLRLLS
jgi:hypothetical protein